MYVYVGANQLFFEKNCFVERIDGTHVDSDMRTFSKPSKTHCMIIHIIMGQLYEHKIQDGLTYPPPPPSTLFCCFIA